MSRKADTPTELWIGFATHAAAWFGVSVFVRLPSIAVFFWGVGLAVHLVRTLQRARELRANAAPAPAPAVPLLAAHPMDELLNELEVWRARGQVDLDLIEIRTHATRVHDKRAQLEALADHTRLERLEGDLRAARERAAVDPAFAAEAEAITERLATLREAATLAERLGAQERTLHHQLEALRVSLAAASDAGEAPDCVADQVASIRARLRATQEVERAVEQARRSGR